MSWIRRNIKIIAPVTVVALVGVAYLAFGVFGVHTLFIDDKVDEANPFAEPTASTEQTATTDASAPEVSEAPTPTTAPLITTLASGQFESRDHPSSGLATVITDGDQTFLRFEDDFATDNGPDLNVYLSKAPITSDSGAFDDDFVDLGVLKGNIGDQNYEIPTDVDLSVYDTVVVWCVRFSTPFTAADLA